MALTSLGLSHSSPSPSLPSSAPSSPMSHKTLSLLLPRVLVSPSGSSSSRSGGGEQLLRGSPHFGVYTTATGTCRASQAVDLFPSVWPEVTVRDARLEDCWEVADTHCSCFFPDYTFPVDLVLRIDRFVGLLSGFSVPPGCMRTCLVAVTDSPFNDKLYIGCEDFKLGGFEGKFSINRGSVAGILTVDTVADFLPRKGLLRQRRTGIAYISNVAVREADRRKGIAKMLVAKAEARARSWGCRSMALHCDVNNLAAMRLYKGQGFKCIKVPENAKWPEPKTSPGIQFNFMMKLLVPDATP
ncbi:GCN5-related N-acetyltransferase 4, chloroplastic-like [Musa acuminata AAA Group]|uniref:GCN5-related N-acetyltransferase 4, chloroplastic-like n=1 Tax=Musa acuminata AAA Group TaxID=214697 RepID=UPI0031DBEE1C